MQKDGFLPKHTQMQSLEKSTGKVQRNKQKNVQYSIIWPNYGTKYIPLAQLFKRRCDYLKLDTKGMFHRKLNGFLRT